ncbi:Ivy family c-type lysozyme inhibitor [uncultured Bradyrhizobium sp.]|uniref:Ivy family c-type lysozyme inhibitor n=1 Tax=uncultured Bradyrhizobium sp. TaxID=199684 RepID=UPI002608877B|nr:Ivy family c-type lysozyme inhibitor [uncultured Bradyrhizobium sp.]
MRRQVRWTAIGLVTLCIACSPAMAIGYLSGVLQKPAYVQSLMTLLGNAPGWTREILKKNGPYISGVRTTENIAGITHEQFHMCVPQPNCDDTTIVLLFAPNGAQAWAGLREKGVVSFLGNPTDAQQAVLRKQLAVPELPPKVTTPYLFDVLKRPAYAQASKNLIEHAGKLPGWARDVLARNDVAYSSSSAELVDIHGVKYEVFTVCAKEYNCSRTHLALMFAPSGTQAWGVLVHEGVMSYLGAATDAQLAVMREALNPDERKWGSPSGK